MHAVALARSGMAGTASREGIDQFGAAARQFVQWGAADRVPHCAGLPEFDGVHGIAQHIHEHLYQAIRIPDHALLRVHQVGEGETGGPRIDGYQRPGIVDQTAGRHWLGMLLADFREIHETFADGPQALGDALHAGEPISQRKIAQSQQKLYDLGIFSKVQTALQNPEGLEESKYVILHLDEASRYSFSAGFGAELGRIGGGTTTFEDPAGTTGFSPRVSLGVSRINFLGLGHTQVAPGPPRHRKTAAANRAWRMRQLGRRTA